MRRFLLSVMLSAWFLLAVAPHVFADVNDFIITKFDAEYSITKDDPQGRLKVKETITVEFSDNNHGILRALPLKYKTKLNTSVLSVNKVSGEEWPFTIYTENDNLILKIGDPNLTVTGEQTFIVNYQMDNVITFYPNHDEFYWDINGDDWDQPFVEVSANINLPPGLKTNEQLCYSGGFGDQSKNCQVANLGANVLASAVNLKPNQTLTAVISFEKGFFKPPTWRDKIKDNFGLLAGTVLPPLIFGTWAYKRWKKLGKDPKGAGVIVPEYGPPKGLSPAEVGTVIDYNVGTRDISATIIDLAIRKYLKINVEEKRRLLKKNNHYSFELINPNFSSLKPHEKEILEGIFSLKQKGEVVELSSLKEEFYKTSQSVQKKLSESLTSGGMFSSNPTKAGVGMWIVAGVLIFGAFIFRSSVSIGFVLSALIVGVFASLMKQRTQTGQNLKDKIEGLKLYLKVAEADRLKKMQSPSAPYASNATQPKRTAELFEKLLPYAIVLGAEKDWAKQFEGIYTEPPDWYGGNWSTFNMVYFSSSLSDGVNAMSSNFSPPSSSGSSGAGGGGFSGGGGGGGGGGGW